MPTVFIVLFCFVGFAVAGLVIGYRTNSIEASSASFAIGLLGALVCFLGSFAFESGTPTITDTKDFRMEITPYRVIITGPTGSEHIWKDAYTVAHAKDIVLLRITTPHNAWGVELTNVAKAAAVFKDDVEVFK